MLALASYLNTGSGSSLEGLRAQGRGLVVGLVDAAIEPDIADLRGARVLVHSLARRPGTGQALRDHGTCSASLLVGQGHQHLLGLVPRATLHIATIAEHDGVAEPARAASAIDLLVARGASVIAVPMGGREHEPALAAAVARAVAHQVQVVAAAGPAGEAWAPACFSGVRSVFEPRYHEAPAVAADGALSMRSGTSIACVITAGLVALAAA